MKKPEEPEVVEAEVIDDKAIELAYSYEPAVITADFPAMQKRLNELLADFEGMDAENVKTLDTKVAKACRADLNAMSKDLNEARKAIKREYNKPLAEFEAKVKELDAQIMKPRDILDKAIKGREEYEKQLRFEALEQAYVDFAPALADVVPFEKLLDPRWLNASYGEKKAENSLFEKAAGLAADWHTLRTATLHFPEETERFWFANLSLSEALNYDVRQWEEQQKIDRMKEEVIPYQPEPEMPQIVEVDSENGYARAAINGVREEITQFRFSLTVPYQEFVTNVLEASALKNHLQQFGLQIHMTKSEREVINV